MNKECFHEKNKITVELWQDKYGGQRSWWHLFFNAFPLIKICDECGENIENLELCPNKEKLKKFRQVLAEAMSWLVKKMLYYLGGTDSIEVRKYNEGYNEAKQEIRQRINKLKE